MINKQLNTKKMGKHERWAPPGCDLQAIEYPGALTLCGSGKDFNDFAWKTEETQEAMRHWKDLNGLRVP